MASLQPYLRGSLSNHPLATAFANEVLRVHSRYANEIVGAFSFCPFMKDVESSFGHFCVMLDTVPDRESTVEAVLEATSTIMHIVFPLIETEPQPFERFAASVRETLVIRMRHAPMMAVFHPRLSGDFSTSHRVVGVIRRAPDPFVQFIPEGLQTGGTVFMESFDISVLNMKSHGEKNFEKVQGEGGEEVMRRLADIHADREKSYAPYLKEILGKPF